MARTRCPRRNGAIAPEGVWRAEKACMRRRRDTGSAPASWVPSCGGADRAHRRSGLARGARALCARSGRGSPCLVHHRRCTLRAHTWLDECVQPRMVLPSTRIHCLPRSLCNSWHHCERAVSRCVAFLDAQLAERTIGNGLWMDFSRCGNEFGCEKRMGEGTRRAAGSCPFFGATCTDGRCVRARGGARGRAGWRGGHPGDDCDVL